MNPPPPRSTLFPYTTLFRSPIFLDRNPQASHGLSIIERSEDVSPGIGLRHCNLRALDEDRKSTRLNSSHSQISYAVFCLKKKKHKENMEDYQYELFPHITIG